MTTRTPAAYIRRSSADANNPGQFSRDEQEAAVRRMAAADGQPDPEMFVDWGVSGGKADRIEYTRLKTAIAAGQVSRVYALNLSRIGRSLIELLAFVELCNTTGTVLKLDKDPVDTSTASGRMLLGMLGTVAQFTREIAAESTAASLKRRSDRGDVLGQPHYGYQLAMVDGRYVEVPDPERPVQPLLDAVREAGSGAAAVRLLNERGIPSRRGFKWSLSSLIRVVEHEAPGLIAQARRERPYGHHPSMLAGILRCHCGSVMTPNPSKGQYYCHKARVTAGHGKAGITEALILPWIKAEAARLLRVPETVDMGEADAGTERAALESQRERIHTLYRQGVITDDELASDWADVRAALDALDARERIHIVDIPQEIDWERWTPDAINSVLRTLWERVELDEHLHPIAAVWRLPPEYVA